MFDKRLHDLQEKYNKLGWSLKKAPKLIFSANFSSLFHKLFEICNSKTQFSSSNQLGNAVVLRANKANFLSQFVDWVKTWSTCLYFTLTKQTSYALIIILKTTF